MSRILPLEDATKKHGSYAVSVGYLTVSLECYAAEDRGEAFDLDSTAKHLAVIVGHMLSMPHCHLCNAGLSPCEKDCLDAIARLGLSKNRYILEDTTVRVFIADGKDHETVEDPLAAYARHLRGKIPRTVPVRVAREGGEARPVMLN